MTSVKVGFSIMLLRYKVGRVLARQDLARFLAKVAFVGIVGFERIAEGFRFVRQT